MVRDNVLISQGPVVSYRSFKHGKRSAWEIAEDEFNAATESLMQMVLEELLSSAFRAQEFL